MTDDTSLSDVQFFLMGSVEARAGSESVVLGRKQERCLIGLLLLDCGRPVSLERLADLLWDGTPPDRARSVIQTYVSRLRARLAPYGVRISGTHGYRIDVDPRDVDFHQLRTGVDLAAEEADPARRLALLDGPLGLCRGPLLGDVAPPGLRLRLGAEAEDLQSTARELCAEAELALGHPDKAIRLVEATAADRPVRERMVAVLMEAYRMSGRKSEAIGVYHAARHALVDDFGVEPGSRLRHLYDEILREDADAAVAATGEVRGAQLPPAAVPFVGRVREFAELDRIVLGAAPPGPRAVVVAGGAGLGKTALVVQWAHHCAGDFPDGQVYVDMRGFTAGTPTTASEAMTQVILALGVDSHRIPTEPAALQPFYRRLTARRRLLVVFDDVATADQVRPALPTGPHTATLITSRRRLFGLTALGDASGLELLPLAPGDALALMTQLLPEHRDNRAVLIDLADLCAYMPLFLRISAANVRLCGDPASFAAAMHGDRALDHLQSGADPTVGARSALGLSYRSLPDHARRLFRAAGRSPLRFVTPDSAGAMLGMDPAQGRWLLERIADVHLVEEFGFGRYRLHDLIRTFAAEQDTGSDGDQALRRLMTFYVGAVTHATATATANEIVTRGATGASRRAARPVRSARGDGLARRRVAQHRRGGPVRGRARSPRAGVADQPAAHALLLDPPHAARVAGDQRGGTGRGPRRGPADVVAPMLNALAVTIWTTNDLDRTRSLLEEALALNLRSGREAAQASNHTNLGSLCRQTGQLGAAFAHTRTAVRLGRRHDRPLTVANALLNLACLHHDLGVLYEASRTVDRALTTYRTLGSTDGQITSLNVLAEIRCELGHHRAAQSAAEQSLEMADTFGSVHGSIFARQAMTDLLIATGRPEAGRELSEAALASAVEHGDRRLIITAILRLAAVLAAVNCADRARHEAERARLLALEQHDLHGYVDALLIMAQLPGEPPQALSHARTAERAAAQVGLLLREAKAQLVRAELSAAALDPTSARSAAAQAWPVLRRSGAKPWITRCIAVVRCAPAPARVAVRG